MECGAWSVAIISIVPSKTPAIKAFLSSLPLKGGFIFHIPLSSFGIVGSETAFTQLYTKVC